MIGTGGVASITKVTCAESGSTLPKRSRALTQNVCTLSGRLLRMANVAGDHDDATDPSNELSNSMPVASPYAAAKEMVIVALGESAGGGGEITVRGGTRSGSSSVMPRLVPSQKCPR